MITAVLAISVQTCILYAQNSSQVKNIQLPEINLMAIWMETIQKTVRVDTAILTHYDASTSLRSNAFRLSFCVRLLQWNISFTVNW